MEIAKAEISMYSEWYTDNLLFAKHVSFLKRLYDKTIHVMKPFTYLFSEYNLHS